MGQSTGSGVPKRYLAAEGQGLNPDSRGAEKDGSRWLFVVQGRNDVKRGDRALLLPDPEG